MRPVIGITTCIIKSPKKTYAAVSSNYVYSILKSGGTPVLLPLVEDPEILEDFLTVIDGLLITGGDEGINPQLYGENPVKELGCICPDRDEYEIYLLNGALKKQIPILGICRGMQLLNVAAGGTLYQDIFVQVKNPLGHLPEQMPVDVLYHSVELAENSILRNVFDTEKLLVNSFHHQAVKRLATSFKATATSEDSIIEAIENPDHDFVVGVQWHPEDLTEKHCHFLKLFENFIKSASRASKI
jgi:putative glutamine amidotransferase